MISSLTVVIFKVWPEHPAKILQKHAVLFTNNMQNDEKH